MRHVVILFVWMVVYSSKGYAEPSVDTHSQVVQKLGPTEVSTAMLSFGGYTLDGQSLSWDDLVHKDKTIIVSYFATWCQPCRTTMPVLESIAKQDSSVQVVYIALGEKSALPVQKMVQELGIHSPVVLDKYEAIGKRHGVVRPDTTTQLPITFVVTPEGIVKTIFTKEGSDFAQRVQQEIAK